MAVALYLEYPMAESRTTHCIAGRVLAARHLPASSTKTL